MRASVNAFVTRIPAFSVAATLIGASATVGGLYGFRLGITYSEALGYVFAAASVAGAFAGSLAVANGLDALRSREFSRAVACALLAAICVSYNSVAVLSLSATVRGDLAAARSAVVERQDLARSARQRALDELRTLKPGKAMDRRRQLEATIAKADAALLTIQTATVGAADPAATAIGVYISAATGQPVSSASIDTWLSLLPVLFLELGSSLAFVALGRATPAAAPTGQPLDALSDGERQLIGALKSEGADGPVTQRGLADKLGLSKSRINQLLAGLKARGVVEVAADTKGTRAKLRAV